MATGYVFYGIGGVWEVNVYSIESTESYPRLSFPFNFRCCLQGNEEREVS